MISMVTIILAMITSTALNAFLNGWQRAAKQKGCENGKAFCGEMTSMGVHLVVWREGTVTKRRCEKLYFILECILCGLAMSNGCGGHIVWVRSELLTYYVGRQKPGVGPYVNPHNLSRWREGSSPGGRGGYFVFQKM